MKNHKEYITKIINLDLKLQFKLKVRAQETTFYITHTKLYVPVVTISTQDHAKLLEQLKSGCKRTISWNKYQQKDEVNIQIS